MRAVVSNSSPLHPRAEGEGARPGSVEGMGSIKGQYSQPWGRAVGRGGGSEPWHSPCVTCSWPLPLQFIALLTVGSRRLCGNANGLLLPHSALLSSVYMQTELRGRGGGQSTPAQENMGRAGSCNKLGIHSFIPRVL